MANLFGISTSPLNTQIESQEQQESLWLKELRDLARGFCGALFIALPLHYTEEMWQRALVIPAWVLLVAVAITYFANVGYIMFEGYKPEPERHQVWLDAITAMGLGALGSLITLILIGRYNLTMPLDVFVRLVVLEMIPASFGASLAINQLGTRSGYKGDDAHLANKLPRDVRKVMATILGALLFSFNIAPTMEPQLITYTISWWHILAILFFSLFLSALMVFFADFIEREEQEGILGPKWVETVVSYLSALLVSAFLLWLFGYFYNGVPFSLALSWTITLGYVTTLGGSAGRVIL